MSDKKKRYEIIKENHKTVSIHFFGSDEVIVYKKITNDDIKSMLEKDMDINLEGCYIKNFSYSYVSFCSLDEILFKPKLLKNFKACGAFFDGDVNFSEAKFGDGDVDFLGANFGDGNVNFSDVKFGNGNVDFSDVKFGDGDVDFLRANFGDGNVYFSEAKFGDGDVNFKNAHFGDGFVDFSFAVFGIGMVDFSDATFGKGTKKFCEAKFGDGVVSFCNTKFGEGLVNFAMAHFGDGDIYFIGTVFGIGDVLFSYATFGSGNVDFTSSEFGLGNVEFYSTEFNKGKVIFNYSSFKEGVFSFANISKIEELNFSIIPSIETIFLFQNCFFSSPISLYINSIKYLLFINCSISNKLLFDSSKYPILKKQQVALFDITNMGTIKLDWKSFGASIIKFNPKKIPLKLFAPNNYVDILSILTNPKHLIKLKSEELCLLKENYHNQGRYDWEDGAYVAFKWIETKSLLKPDAENFIIYLLRLIFKFPIMAVLYFVGRYGTDPFSIFIYMLCVLVTFGFLFCYEWASIFPDITAYKTWSTFYYSAITFFTVGYGDLWAQTGWAAVLCALESFFGVFLMGYFSVALVRKILR